VGKRSWKSFSLDGGTLFLQSSCLSFGSSVFAEFSWFDF
jgi:hypothetical protein